MILTLMPHGFHFHRRHHNLIKPKEKTILIKWFTSKEKANNKDRISNINITLLL